MKSLTWTMLALAASSALQAQDQAEKAPTKAADEHIVVTANPLGSNLFDLVTPVQFLSEDVVLPSPSIEVKITRIGCRLARGHVKVIASLDPRRLPRSTDNESALPAYQSHELRCRRLGTGHR